MDESSLPTIRNGIEDPLGRIRSSPDRNRLRRELGLSPEAVTLATIGISAEFSSRVAKSRFNGSEAEDTMSV